MITKEYSDDWKPYKEAYYTINDERNNKLTEEYRSLAEKEDYKIFTKEEQHEKIY